MAFPEAEALIGHHRERLDPAAAWGVPAHVTVLYPFLPPERLGPDVLAAVTDAVRSVPAFDVVLARVAWFGDAVVWLAPEPDEPFRALTAAVWRRFPQTPPYSGAHPDPVPHLTVGDGAPVGQLRDAAAALAARLPIRTRVDAVSVLCGSSTPRSWHTVVEIPLTQ